MLFSKLTHSKIFQTFWKEIKTNKNGEAINQFLLSQNQIRSYGQVTFESKFKDDKGKTHFYYYVVVSTEGKHPIHRQGKGHGIHAGSQSTANHITVQPLVVFCLYVLLLAVSS